ncbi:MAG: ester cyclase [Actinomycetes bacterium]
MGEARQLMDEVTAAAFSKNADTAAKLYALDAVAVTPDRGEIRGRESIAEYLVEFLGAFPDARYEPLAEHEAGNVAIDEGFVVGTNTGPLVLPTGEIPATGKKVRVRACDIATVKDGVITDHRFYFDQVELLEQLGLLPDLPG